MTTQPSQEEFAAAFEAAIADVLPGEITTRWVFLVETIGADGERGVWMQAPPGAKPWDTLGLLRQGERHGAGRQHPGRPGRGGGLMASFTLHLLGTPVRTTTGIWCDCCHLPSAHTTHVVLTTRTDPTRILARVDITGCQDCGCTTTTRPARP